MPKSNHTEGLRIELATAPSDRGRQLNPPSKGALICLNNAFDVLFPYKVKRPNGVRYKRLARLAWISFAIGTDVTTSKDLTSGEVWRILNWLNGLNPATGDPRSQ